MRLTNLQQIAKGIDAVVDGGVRGHALAKIDRGKWRLWNGHTELGIEALMQLERWAQASRVEHIPP